MRVFSHSGNLADERRRLCAKENSFPNIFAPQAFHSAGISGIKLIHWRRYDSIRMPAQEYA
jgi:hypothetical protein